MRSQPLKPSALSKLPQCGTRSTRISLYSTSSRSICLKMSCKSSMMLRQRTLRARLRQIKMLWGPSSKAKLMTECWKIQEGLRRARRSQRWSCLTLKNLSDQVNNRRWRTLRSKIQRLKLRATFLRKNQRYSNQSHLFSQLPPGLRLNLTPASREN